jgi:hypothetical protein
MKSEAMQELVKQVADEIAQDIASIVLHKVRMDIAMTVKAGYEFGWTEAELAEKLRCGETTLAEKRRSREIDSTRNPAGRPFYMPHHVLSYLLRGEIKNGRQTVSMRDVLPFPDLFPAEEKKAAAGG